uniref:MULE transposase domain-containing protein n=1 Tax=Chenopodium quinoa TaxID=63459 RepID=A0A803MQX6_CHEQI
MKSSGLTTMDTYNYMATEAGGEQNVGHSVVDHLNFCSRLRMEQIKAGDAQTLVNILNQEQSKDLNFFFKVKLEKEGRISNIFWRDLMMLKDYRIYGDVLVFDTTYRTNKYILICAPFVGINNHWHNCMFACGFIEDEKTDSFVWLLETFLKAMENRTPTSIFTDQDQAMANAIEQVFTLSLFRDFKEEFGYSMATTVQMIGRNEEFLLYQVALEDKPWSAHQNSTLAFSNKNTRQVCFKKMAKFEKTEAWDRNSLKMVEDLLASATQRESAEAASNIPNVADSNHGNDDVSLASSTSTSVPTILDPQRAVTKGRSKRAKGGLEKSKRKRKPALPPPHSKFGSKTPNLRLF